MIIEFRKVSKAGNNLAASMFFDGRLVADVQCSPTEFEAFYDILVTGHMELDGKSEDITRNDRH